MKITILAAGSRGDTQPYIALGQALIKKGCEVKIATFAAFEEFVRKSGLDFALVRGDITKVASGDLSQGARQADNPFKILLSFQHLKTLVYDLQKDFYQACFGSDAIVWHPGPAIGYFAAQQMHIPSILAAPFPMAPTREYPSLLFYNSPRLGKAMNLLTHKIMEQIFWSTSSSPVKEFWKKEFGHLPQGFGNPFPRQTTRRCPTIISCSKYVFPTPGDWPENVYNTGYWFLEEEAGWEPSPALIDFLQDGPPPVYVGFGSIADPGAARQTTELVIGALRRSGQRGILATGWNGMTRLDNLPEGIFMLESAPHSWLFPRMAVVVHHGGAGTTSAGLRAGVPTVIIPHANDQFAWGRRVYELGVAAKPIPKKKLTADKLCEAIEFALAKERMDAARELGVKIRSENGAEKAAEIILRAMI